MHVRIIIESFLKLETILKKKIWEEEEKMWNTPYLITLFGFACTRKMALKRAKNAKKVWIVIQPQQHAHKLSFISSLLTFRCALLSTQVQSRSLAMHSVWKQSLKFYFDLQNWSSFKVFYSQYSSYYPSFGHVVAINDASG